MKESLAIKNPVLAKQWHPIKNGDLTPNDVTSGSDRKVWWQCEKGHEWEAIIGNRTRGSGCPKCGKSNRVSNMQKSIIKKRGSLQNNYPDLAKQWHPIKNGDLTPNDVTSGSYKKVWWQCEKGHEWEAIVNNRSRGNACPFCMGKCACVDNSLQTLNPELSKQWHPSKNGNLTPDDVTEYSFKKVWWLCENGHEWEALISNRTNGAGCQFCMGKSACADNCLQTLNPELSKQWHPTKNGDLTPNDVRKHSNKKVWWLCEKGHEWKATINSRAYGSGCPDCNQESQTSFPEQSLYFYVKMIFNDALNRYKYNGKTEIDVFVPSLNLGIEYDGIYFHKEKKDSDYKKEKHLVGKGIYFLRIKELNENIVKCYRNDNIIHCNSKPSDFQLDEIIEMCFHYISENITYKQYRIDVDVKRDRAKIYDLFIKGEVERSLYIKYPEVSKQWHPTKNLNLKPDMVKSNAHKKVWWQCKEGHEWEATVNNRINGGNDCPFCAGKRACTVNSLQTLNPELAKQWHPSKNGNLTPNDVTEYSFKKVWWLCKKGHEWEATIARRSSGCNCPFCSGQRVCADNSLQTLNPNLAKQWHTTKNGKLTPNDVTTGSNKKVWWRCEKKHEWEAAIVNRSSGTGCPYCSGQRVYTDNSLQTINPDLAEQWHPTKNGNLTPNDVTTGSIKKVWWQCEKGHEWEAAVKSRHNGCGCPFCSGRHACVDNCLQTLNPELSKQWHPTKNVDLTPNDVTAGSKKKVWWQCKKGHEWEAIITNRAKGSGCPICYRMKIKN